MASLWKVFIQGTIRFRELNITGETSCNDICTEIWGHLPDETTLSEMKAFYENPTISSSHSYRWSQVHFGVSYDFDQKKWLNNFDQSELNSSIWTSESFGLISMQHIVCFLLTFQQNLTLLEFFSRLFHT